MTEFYTKDGDEFKKVEDTLLPQADVDKIVESRLDRQKKQFADYDDLKEKAGKVDTISKEWEEKLKAAGDEKSAIETELGAAKLETVKVKAIHQFKLSDDLSEFLNGPDEKTILSQAEKLSKGVGGSSVVIDKNKKPEGDDKKNSDTKQAVKSLFGPSKSDD
jgi:uncharacterized protein YqfA (UPF0365 family)